MMRKRVVFFCKLGWRWWSKLYEWEKDEKNWKDIINLTMICFLFHQLDSLFASSSSEDNFLSVLLFILIISCIRCKWWGCNLFNFPRGNHQFHFELAMVAKRVTMKSFTITTWELLRTKKQTESLEKLYIFCLHLHLSLPSPPCNHPYSCI